MAPHRGIAAALVAALLFGASTPFAKLLLDHVQPWMLAALLYLGSGVGLAVWRLLMRLPRPTLPAAEWGWLAGAIVAGGLIAPVLLMVGLTSLPASSASLLLNAEGVFTALIAWTLFRENFDARVLLGMLAIVTGAVVLSWPANDRVVGSTLTAWPALAVVAACLAWGIDNNLTRKVSLTDATFVAMVKGLAAGTTNLVLASIVGASWPRLTTAVSAGALGLVSYGVSLALFVIALRELGTARTGAYFSVAPFFGALLAVVVVGDAVTPPLIAAGLLMGIGVWLHMSERHAHVHRHEPLIHEHAHVHAADGDPHHDHEHTEPVTSGTRHRHRHRHEALTHAHSHFPDAHHRHDHSDR